MEGDRYAVGSGEYDRVTRSFLFGRKETVAETYSVPCRGGRRGRGEEGGGGWGERAATSPPATSKDGKFSAPPMFSLLGVLLRVPHYPKSLDLLRLPAGDPPGYQGPPGEKNSGNRRARVSWS